jgi:ACS family D-galactonate transporter-like MFS transporter
LSGTNGAVAAHGNSLVDEKNLKEPSVSAGLPQRWLVLALLVGGVFFAYVHRSALSIAAPFVSKDLGLNPGATGVLLSVFFWSYSIAQMPAGWLADRFGVGRVYATGFMIWAVAAVLTGLAPSFAVLVLLRLVMGLGQGIVFPGSARAIANWFSAKERGGATATFLSGMRVGQAAITSFGAATIAIYGWRFFFIVTGLAGVVWLVPWLVFHWQNERVPLSAEVAVTRVGTVDSLRLLRDRRMLGVFATFFAVDYVWLLNATWVPGYFLTQRNFSPDEMTMYLSVPLIFMLVSGILAGIASDAIVRTGRNEVAVRKWFVIVGMGIGCVIGAVGAVQNGHVAGLCVAVSIQGLGIASTNLWSLTQAIAGRNRTGFASGAQNFVGTSGGIIAPIVTGYIAQSTGSFLIAFLVAAVLLVFGGVAGWVLLREN